jgi:hypothetical protein
MTDIATGSRPPRAPLPAWAAAMDRRLKAEDRHEPPVRSRRRRDAVSAATAREGQGADATVGTPQDADRRARLIAAMQRLEAMHSRDSAGSRRRSRRKPPQ